jgi:AraC-like DNA-binding protein
MKDNYFKDIQFRVITHRFKIYNGSKIARSETNSLEFIRSGEIFLEDENGTLKALKAPAFYRIRTGKKFRYVFAPDAPRGSITEHLYLDFTGPRTDRMMDALDALFPSGVITPADPEEMGKIFFRIVKLYRSSKEKHHAEIAALTEMVMALAVNSSKVKKSGSGSDALEECAEMFRREPFKKYDFKLLAAKAGFSQDHFRRLFRQETGIPPWHYVLDCRIRYASQLLTATDKLVKEIACECGFNGEFHFSREFKKIMKKSPENFRKSI